MKRLGIIAALAAVVVLVAGMMAQAQGGHHARRATTMHVIEHATTDKVIDTGKKGDTSGDLLTWHNKIYDETDSSVVGSDQGDCIRISPKQGTWECRWITWLDGGSITVEGPFYDTKDGVLAITGGTGAYAGVSGDMQLLSKNGGAEYDFIFNIL